MVPSLFEGLNATDVTTWCAELGEAAGERLRQHWDSFITRDRDAAAKFQHEVDSAVVLHNASTRFADGFEYGLGAEIGISTDKFHARGPVGLEGLTSMKWVVLGQGEVRS